MILQSEHKTRKFQASCKLMLLGEYLVLNGSKSLSFPLKFGQSLEVTPNRHLVWESYSLDGLWFSVKFDKDLNISTTSDRKIAGVLQQLFQQIRKNKPDLNLSNAFKIMADFNLRWGLGSSSTLISLLGQWSGVDPSDLLSATFGGSGYDLACATAEQAIVYSVTDGLIGHVTLNESITNKLLFVYLGKKQSSKEEIRRFEKLEVYGAHIDQMNAIIQQAIDSESIEQFEDQINRSEDLLSRILGREKLKEHIFADYKYAIKSLGAWGGDFFLASFRELKEAKNYFKTKGLSTLFTYNELVK